MPSALDSIPNTNFKKVLRFYIKDVKCIDTVKDYLEK